MLCFAGASDLSEHLAACDRIGEHQMLVSPDDQPLRYCPVRETMTVLGMDGRPFLARLRGSHSSPTLNILSDYRREGDRQRHNVVTVECYVCNVAKMRRVCSLSADCRDSPLSTIRARGHVDLISHGSVVPLFGVPPCAVRAGRRIGEPGRLGGVAAR